MKQKEYKLTTNNSIYNKFHKEIHSGCSYCGWHKGCNGHHGIIENRNWKQFRKKQYKNEKV